MREVEIVEHLQIDGLRVFFDTVQYRTPHVHRELELIWLSDGDLDVRIEHTQLLAHPGEMVLFHPGQLHEFRSPGAGCTFLCVQVAPELVEHPYPAFSRLRFALPCPGRVLAPEQYRLLVELLWQLTETYLQRPQGYELTCTGQVCQLLGALVAGMPHQVLSGSELAGQQRRNDRFYPQTDLLDDDLRNGDRMQQIRLARTTAHTRMRLLCKEKGTFDKVPVCLGLLGEHLGDELIFLDLEKSAVWFQHLLQDLGQHFTGVLEGPAVGCHIHFLGMGMRFDLDFAVLVQVMRADQGAGAAEDGIALFIQDADGLEIGGVYDRSKLV